MNLKLWLKYTAAISCLVFGLSKGITPLLSFTGNIHTIVFCIGLMWLGFAFSQTKGFLLKKESPKVLDDDFDDEFHNDFSKVGSGTEIKEVRPEDHTLGTRFTQNTSEIEKDLDEIIKKP